MSKEAYRLFSTAPRREGCSYVLPLLNDPTRHMTYGQARIAILIIPSSFSLLAPSLACADMPCSMAR